VLGYFRRDLGTGNWLFYKIMLMGENRETNMNAKFLEREERLRDRKNPAE
jgi:hypothetical protein